MGKQISYLLVNFGGPRTLDEVEEFLIELLSDQEVIRTPFPPVWHRFLFRRVAKKRTLKVSEDYEKIGGKSPIFEDTEALAEALSKRLNAPVHTFHRYLPQTHKAFLEKMQSCAEEIRVLPLFPQFSFATTGSIALWFSSFLPAEIVEKMRWIKSYPQHPDYILSMQQRLGSFLKENHLQEEELFLLFSAHGLPQEFDDTGDPYRRECESSYLAIKQAFPHALSLLSYQSQFGNQPWLQPYTSDVTEQIDQYTRGRKKIVIIPLSFTSDHIETLFEIEYLYREKLQEKGYLAYRCPALNLDPFWIDTLASLFQEGPFYKNSHLRR